MKANHLDVVQQEHARQPPTSGDLLSCFRFEQRVLDRLAREFPGEAWGYLKKGGENTIPYRDETIKVGRVCGPDAQLYKILTDIPTENAPIWNDDGNVAADLGGPPSQFYLAYDGAASASPVPPTPPPAPIPAPPSPPPSPDLSARFDSIEQQLATIATNLIGSNFGGQIAQLNAVLHEHEDMSQARHADVVAHFDELKRILAGLTFEGQVQIRYLPTAKFTLQVPKPKE